MAKNNNEFDKDSWMQEKVSPFVKTVLKDAQLNLIGSDFFLETSDMTWNRENINRVFEGDYSLTESLYNQTKLKYRESSVELPQIYKDSIALRVLAESVWESECTDIREFLKNAYVRLIHVGSLAIIGSKEFSDKLIAATRTKGMVDIYSNQADDIENRIMTIVDSAAACLKAAEFELSEHNIQYFLANKEFRLDLYEKIKANCLENGAILNSYEESAMKNIYTETLEVHKNNIDFLMELSSDIVSLSGVSIYEKGYLNYLHLHENFANYVQG